MLNKKNYKKNGEKKVAIMIHKVAIVAVALSLFGLVNCFNFLSPETGFTVKNYLDTEVPIFRFLLKLAFLKKVSKIFAKNCAFFPLSEKKYSDKYDNIHTSETIDRVLHFRK